MATAAAPRRADTSGGRWPWKQFHFWGVMCLVLAVLVAFFFPATALGGTETMRDRVATTGTVVVLMMLMGTIAGVLHALWIGALYALMVMHIAAAPLVGRVWHGFFPAEAE